MDTDDNALRITDRVRIPLTELSYRASRAGGPGGQHVNTSSTRIELWWVATDSPSLDEAERRRVLLKLAHRLDRRGALRLVSGATRSQLQNKEAVTERFRDLLAQALAVPKPRKRTRPTKASKERRIASKKKRGETKRLRSHRGDE